MKTVGTHRTGGCIRSEFLTILDGGVIGSLSTTWGKKIYMIRLEVGMLYEFVRKTKFYRKT